MCSPARLPLGRSCSLPSGQGILARHFSWQPVGLAFALDWALRQCVNFALAFSPQRLELLLALSRRRPDFHAPPRLAVALCVCFPFMACALRLRLGAFE